MFFSRCFTCHNIMICYPAKQNSGHQQNLETYILMHLDLNVMNISFISRYYMITRLPDKYLMANHETVDYI